MPAFDRCHPQVVRALERAGWHILAENEQYRFSKRSIFVDMRVVRQANGTSQEMLIVEVKCFSDESRYTRELYEATGQYLFYQEMLEAVGLSLPIYLSIPSHIFDTLFKGMVMQIFKKYGFRLLVVNLDTETIEQWVE